jgi:hypothetical protein
MGMRRKRPTPTPDDRKRAEEKLADPNYARDRLMERLVLSEAYEREARERRERRRRRLRRLVPFVRV